MDNFPPELLRITLGFVDKPTLLSCSTVSRSWVNPAQASIFDHLCICDFCPEKNFAAFLSFLQDNAHIGRHIRDLQLVGVEGEHRDLFEVSNDAFPTVDANYLASVLTLTPGVRSLSLFEVFPAICTRPIPSAHSSRLTLSKLVLVCRKRSSMYLQPLPLAALLQILSVFSKLDHLHLTLSRTKMSAACDHTWTQHVALFPAITTTWDITAIEEPRVIRGLFDALSAIEEPCLPRSMKFFARDPLSNAPFVEYIAARPTIFRSIELTVVPFNPMMSLGNVDFTFMYRLKSWDFLTRLAIRQIIASLPPSLEADRGIPAWLEVIVLLSNLPSLRPNAVPTTVPQIVVTILVQGDRPRQSLGRDKIVGGLDWEPADTNLARIISATHSPPTTVEIHLGRGQFQEDDQEREDLLEEVQLALTEVLVESKIMVTVNREE